jgi:hypoxanthine phosphoribosyltransferase
MYDDRMEQTFHQLQVLRPGTLIEYPYRLLTTIPAAHLGGDRDIESFYENLEWVGFRSQAVNTVVVVDDVITSGSRFKACKQIILEYHPDARVIGVFWGRTVWDSVE